MKRPGAWTVMSVAALAWLAIFRPWTIRPIADETHKPFDAREYVAKVWDARALPLLNARTVPFATFQRQPTNGATPVSFEGLVVAVNTSSRVGTAAIDIAPPDGRPDALLMIGPVLRGTAVRDALDFIQFTDFTNQIQFADVANALNDRVLATALAHVEPATLKGRRVRVLGVAWRHASASASANAPEALPFVVPVQLSIGDPQ